MVETEDRTGRGKSVRVWLSAELVQAVEQLAEVYRVENRQLLRLIIAEGVVQRENALAAMGVLAEATAAHLTAEGGMSAETTEK